MLSDTYTLAFLEIIASTSIVVLWLQILKTAYLSNQVSVSKDDAI